MTDLCWVNRNRLYKTIHSRINLLWHKLPDKYKELYWSSSIDAKGGNVDSSLYLARKVYNHGR